MKTKFAPIAMIIAKFAKVQDNVQLVTMDFYLIKPEFALHVVQILTAKFAGGTLLQSQNA